MGRLTSDHVTHDLTNDPCDRLRIELVPARAMLH